MPKISVIVPIYNAEKFISKCIDSIVNQSYKDIEILLINDGSNDTSLEIIKKYKEIDNRIRIIDKENSGVSDTRNLGVKEARGEFIQFIDSDDFVEKDMLCNTLFEIEEEEADLIISGLFLDIQKNNNISTSIQSFSDKICVGKEDIGIGVLERLNGTYINSPINKLYKTKIIKENNIVMDRNIDLGEDLLFNLQYFKHCNKIIFKEKSYYHYNMQVSDNLTFKFRKDKLELMKHLYDGCKDFLSYCNLEKSKIVELNNLFIKWMYSCYIDLNNESCSMSNKEKVSFISESVSDYSEIINNTNIKSFTYKILKYILRYPRVVFIVSKMMYWIKTSLRELVYK